MKLFEHKTTIATTVSNLFLVAAILVICIHPMQDDRAFDKVGELIQAKADPEEISEAWSYAFARAEWMMFRATIIVACLLLAFVWIEMAIRGKLVDLIYQLWWSAYALGAMEMERWFSDLPPYALVLEGAIVATICLLLRRLMMRYRNRKHDSPKTESNAA